MARVTLITPYFWPENTACVPLMTELTADLVTYGHSVTVITSRPTRNVEDSITGINAVDGDPLGYYHGARVIRFPNPTASRRGVAAKLAEAFLLWLWAAVAAIRFAPVTDVFIVYSNPPLLTIPVSWSRIRGRVPIIYNLQDLFPDSAILSGLVHSRLVTRVLKFMEACSYRKADVITAISQTIADRVACAVENARVVVIPNWVDTDRIKSVDPEHNQFSRVLPVDLHSEFVVVYAGNLGFAQDIDVIADAASLLRDCSDIVFVVAGEGQSKESMQRRLSELSLGNVVLMPLQPQALVPHVYSTGDVGLVTVRRGIGGSSVPSKTWPIMACSKPVIACTDADCDLATLIARENVGAVVPPGDARALADAILAAQANRDACLQQGKNARAFVEACLSRKSATAAYCELVNEMTRTREH